MPRRIVSLKSLISACKSPAALAFVGTCTRQFVSVVNCLTSASDVGHLCACCFTAGSKQTKRTHKQRAKYNTKNRMYVYLIKTDESIIAVVVDAGVERHKIEVV